jgi:V8-like Glu-specific endopeptidase
MFTDTDYPRIVGGEPAFSCQWPTVVDMSTCSGVLVHPRIVIYAGHCGQQGEVQFGNTDAGFTISINYEDCQVHPEWTLSGNDIAFCELPVEVTDIPFVHMLGAAEPLPQVGELVTLVGYGETEAGATNGYKNFGQAPYINIEEGELRIGGNGTDTCSGDSGGPAMAMQADGTWRVIGITSKADGGSDLCGGISRYTYAPTAVAWVEQVSGIDVSPCFDGVVPMGCEPSDSAPDDPQPDWCDWNAGASETGVDESGEPASTGDAEDGLDSTGRSGSESTDGGVEAMPGDDGCSCSAGLGGGVWPAVLFTVLAYRATRTTMFTTLLRATLAVLTATGCASDDAPSTTIAWGSTSDDSSGGSIDADSGTEIPAGFYCPDLLDLLGLDSDLSCAAWHPYGAQGLYLVDGTALNLDDDIQTIYQIRGGAWPLPARGVAWLDTDSWTEPGSQIDLFVPADLYAYATAVASQQPEGTQIVGMYATLVTQDSCLGIEGPAGPAESLVRAYGFVHAAPLDLVGEEDETARWRIPRCMVGSDIVDRDIPHTVLSTTDGEASAVVDNALPYDLGIYGNVVLVVDLP